MLAQEDHDLRAREDPHVRWQAQLEGELADERITERVERRDRCVRVAVWDQLVDADGHLFGRLVREGEREDLRRSSPARRDQPRNPAGDDLRLAGARAGDDEERTFAVGHRPELVRVQPAEKGIEPGGRLGLARRIEGGQLAPGRDLVEGRRLAADPGARHRDVGGHDRSIRGRRAT